MATYKLNPQALNNKWGGGVICLELGSTKPDNFDDIIVTLREIVESEKHYIVSIYDTVDNCFFGDCEVIYYQDGHFDVFQNLIYASGMGRILQYRFYDNAGIYSRTTTNVKVMKDTDYNNLLTRISALEQKLNEITTKE